LDADEHKPAKIEKMSLLIKQKSVKPRRAKRRAFSNKTQQNIH
jgi:hypothetical protein